jgi:peptide deformylase
MALRNIVIEGDPVLGKIAKEVKDVNDHVREIIDDMTETMRHAQGIGLAAPQIGVLRRLVVIELGDQLYELVNPRIVEQDGDQFEEEACLSVPGMAGRVHRPAWVKVEALDRNGQPVTYEGTELLARAFCHELDHLDGILYDSKAEEMRSTEDDEYEDLEDEAEEAAAEEKAE